jgi:hypothetical protein
MTDLLDIRRIYVEPAAADLPRGKAVLARFPDAERVEVDGHQRIPDLFGDETNAVFAKDLLGWDPRGRTRIRFSLRTGDKGRYVARLTGLIAERAPYCRVRYAF